MPTQCPSLGPGAIGPVAPAQSGTSTPNIGLSQDVPPVVAANNLVLDALLVGVVPGAVLPVVQAALQVVNTIAQQSVSITAAATTMYAISVSMSALGTAPVGHTLTANITYTAANGAGVQTVSLTLPLNTPNVVLETYPLLALAGTPLSLATAYGGGATAGNPVDAYTISARLVEMPL